MEKEKENFIAVCYPHWAGFLRYWIFAAFFILFWFYGLINGDILASLLVMLFGTMIASAGEVLRRTTYLGFTETKLVGHTGFIRTKKLSTPLNRVQGISLENGLIGKIFGFHTITVSNAGTGSAEFVFKGMANAEQFVDKVQEVI